MLQVIGRDSVNIVHTYLTKFLPICGAIGRVRDIQNMKLPLSHMTAVRQYRGQSALKMKEVCKLTMLKYVIMFFIIYFAP